MEELAGTAALAAELRMSADELRVLTRRVQREDDARPHVDAAGWNGPAAWACRLSLALLAQEIAVAVDLLRCAGDLVSAAAWELTGDA